MSYVVSLQVKYEVQPFVVCEVDSLDMYVYGWKNGTKCREGGFEDPSLHTCTCREEI